jgi:hypothetical protein
MTVWSIDFENEMARQDPPSLPERHAWLEWEGPGTLPTASGRPIPVSNVEPATTNGYTPWRGWEAHIPLETGVTCVLWSPYAGWLEAKQDWQWDSPSLEPRLFVNDDRERLCLRLLRNGNETEFHTHRGCKGLECRDAFRYGHDKFLHADEDLWMYLSDWSRYPIIREDRMT